MVLFCVQVSGAYSKSWSYREDALLAVYKKLMEMAASTAKEDLRNMLRAAIFLVKRAIKDIVSSVSGDVCDKKMSPACNLLHLRLLCPSEISKASLSAGITQCWNYSAADLKLRQKNFRYHLKNTVVVLLPYGIFFTVSFFLFRFFKLPWNF